MATPTQEELLQAILNQLSKKHHWDHLIDWFVIMTADLAAVFIAFMTIDKWSEFRQKRAEIAQKLMKILPPIHDAAYPVYRKALAMIEANNVLDFSIEQEFKQVQALLNVPELLPPFDVRASWAIYARAPATQMRDIISDILAINGKDTAKLQRKVDSFGFAIERLGLGLATLDNWAELDRIPAWKVYVELWRGEIIRVPFDRLVRKVFGPKKHDNT